MRRRTIVVIDVLVAALAVVAGTVIQLGGFIVRIGDLRLSLRTPERVLLWLGAIVLFRLILDRRTPPFGISRDTWRRVLLVPAGSDPFRIRAAPGLWRRAMVASLGLALALGILLQDQVRQPYSVPDHGDPLFSIWRMAWVIHQLGTDPAHLFDANIFYPERLTLTFSDPIILPALAAAPLFAAGVHPVVVYNVMLFSGFWVSGIATYLLVERLTGSPRAAFIAGLMYASYSYRFDHYSHLELQMTPWMPLGLLALHLFVSTGRWPYALALGLAGVAQLYSSMYYAVFFLVYAATIGAGLLVVHRPSLRRVGPPLAAAALLAGLIAVPLVFAFVAAQPAKGERPVSEITYYSATMSDYLRAHKYSAIWTGTMLPVEPERALFPGAAPLILGAIGLAPPFSAVRLVYIAGLLVALDGSLGFNGALYPRLHRWFAPVRGLRVPARFGMLVGLTLAVFAGFGALRVLRWCRRDWMAHVVFTTLIAAVVIDAWPSLRLTPVWREPPAIYERVAATAGAVLAELPVMPNEDLSTPFMYFSIWHWKPLVNGYSGFIPQSYRSLAPDLLAFPREGTADALRRRGVTHVTVNCGLRYPGCEQTADVMRQSKDLRRIRETRWQGGSVELYELIR